MAENFENLDILIVDDNAPVLALAKSVLKTFGVRDIYTARNGEEAFAVFCRENPDIVIADWMMQPVDGIALTRRIRTDPASPNPFAPVILVTAHGERKLVEEARDAGVTEFLVKPFNAKDLYSRIVQILETPRAFVRAGGYFGPDRRRREEFHSDMKRETDEQKN